MVNDDEILAAKYLGILGKTRIIQQGIEDRE